MVNAAMWMALKVLSAVAVHALAVSEYALGKGACPAGHTTIPSSGSDQPCKDAADAMAGMEILPENGGGVVAGWAPHTAGKGGAAEHSCMFRLPFRHQGRRDVGFMPNHYGEGQVHLYRFVCRATPQPIPQQPQPTPEYTLGKGVCPASHTTIPSSGSDQPCKDAAEALAGMELTPENGGGVVVGWAPHTAGKGGAAEHSCIFRLPFRHQGRRDVGFMPNHYGEGQLHLYRFVCRAIPTTATTPQPTPEPTPQPTPEPTPQPTPEPTPQPTPQPSPQPTPAQRCASWTTHPQKAFHWKGGGVLIGKTGPHDGEDLCKQDCDAHESCVGYSWRSGNPLHVHYHKCFLVSSLPTQTSDSQEFTSAVCNNNRRLRVVPEAEASQEKLEESPKRVAPVFV